MPVADAVLCQLPVVFDTAQIIALAIAVVFLFVSGFVSGSEIAFFSIDPEDEELDDAPEGDAVRRLLKSPERLLATILISNNLVNVTIVVLESARLVSGIDQGHTHLSLPTHDPLLLEAAN